MPCLAQEHRPKLPGTGHYCKSLSSLIRETYAHCHVPCVRVPAGAGWSSGEDSDDDSGLDQALDTKQVILNEMRNRQMKKRSRCSVDSSPSPTLLLSSAALAWSYTPLDTRTVLEKMSSPKKCVVVETGEKEKEEEEAARAAGGDDGGDCDADDESEAFFSVKSFFTRSTSRAATVASSVADIDLPPLLLRSPETWEGFRDCDGWPFGLCRRHAVLPLPPLPSTPADSWKWRKSASSLAGSPAHAYYNHKITTASPIRH